MGNCCHSEYQQILVLEGVDFGRFRLALGFYESEPDTDTLQTQSTQRVCENADRPSSTNSVFLLFLHKKQGSVT